MIGGLLALLRALYWAEESTSEQHPFTGRQPDDSSGQKRTQNEAQNLQNDTANQSYNSIPPFSCFVWSKNTKFQ